MFKDNSIEDFFLGMFNNKLSVALLKVGKMGSFNRKCNDISKKEIENLAGIINEFDFVTTGKMIIQKVRLPVVVYQVKKLTLILWKVYIFLTYILW